MRATSSALLCLVLAVSLVACGSKKAGTTMTIRLIATSTSSKVLVDREPKNSVSAGDVLWSRATLRNAVAQFGKPKGAVVGRNIVTNTVVSRFAGEVRVTATLPGGTIRLAGRVSDTPRETIQVTGGTGRYAGASGRGSTRSRLTKSGSLTVYRLRLP